MFANVVHIGHSQQASQLFRRNLHWTRRRRRTRMRLREGGRGGRVESDIAFYLLHGLMNVSIENRYRSKTLQIRKCLGTVFGAPSPLRIDIPERHVRKHNHRRTLREMSDV